MATVSDGHIQKMSCNGLEEEEEIFSKLSLAENNAVVNGTNAKKDPLSEETLDGKAAGQLSAVDILPSIARISSAPGDLAYNMNHKRRGYCLIFNHSNFDKFTSLNDRNGTNKDRDDIYSLFRLLSFDVLVFNNLAEKEVMNILDKYSMEVDHSDCDCLAVFYMSHGEEGHVWSRNSMFKADEIFKRFTADNCPTLAGKPKMFFIQACRGDGLDDGVMVTENQIMDETDDGQVYKIPSHVDFLISWSTIPGHFSWRNTCNGSWFIQSLVTVFRDKVFEEDVLKMMTRVNQTMAYSYQSNCPSSPRMHGMKQTASITFTLTRDIYLKPKPKK